MGGGPGDAGCILGHMHYAGGERRDVVARLAAAAHAGDRVMKKKLGMLLLGAWLVLHALIELIGLSFSGLGTVMAIVALVAGVALLLDR